MHALLTEHVLHQQLRSLPSLSGVALEILQSMDDDWIDTGTLTSKIANDIGIASRVMRVANSPFFGSSGQIGSLKEATLLLGFDSVRGLVTSAALIQAFPSDMRGFNVKAFWAHGLQIAVCAKLLAKASHLEPETAFTAGLLHDIGLLVMALIDPEKIQAIQAEEGSMTALNLELELFGMQHAQVGGLITTYWHLPAEISAAIRHHHDAIRASTAMQPDMQDVIYVASLYAEYHQQEVSFSPYQKEFIEQAEKRLGLSEQALQALVQDIEQLYEATKLMIRE